MNLVVPMVPLARTWRGRKRLTAARAVAFAASLLASFAASFASIDAAMAQGDPTAKTVPVATGAIARAGLLHVWQRLDTTGAALIIGAVVILLLLVLRIWIMVRGERAPQLAAGRERSRSTIPDTGSLDRQTITGPTDWGHDLNKRASLSRDRSATRDRLSDLNLSATQWSLSEVQSAAAISRQANDSMGKPSNPSPSPYRTSFNPYFRGDTANAETIEVVEVADALLQAELLVQLGDPKQAMTLLSNHIRDTEKPGPAVWLMLLNLYQSTGRKAQYEALATGFKTLFNASVPPWAAKRDAASRDLESYPQVMLRLHAAWGKADARPLLDSLLNDDRGGSRLGFSLGAYRDLLFLLEVLGELDRMAAEEAEREKIQRKLGRIA